MEESFESRTDSLGAAAKHSEEILTQRRSKETLCGADAAKELEKEVAV